MKLNLRPVIAGAAALVITGGVLAAAVGTAAAAGTPPWEPDPGSLGSLTLYNSAGVVVTGGNNLSHLFDYAQASTADANTGIKATLNFAQPSFGEVTGIWPVGQASTSVVTPPTAAGTPPALAASTTPVATSGATGANLTNFIASQQPQTQAGYVNVYQVRVVTGGGGGGSGANSQYWEDDIQVNPSAGTWTQIFPAVAQATSTVLTAAPNPAVTTSAVALTATESPATGGSVVFSDGGTTLGSSTVNGSGVATLNEPASTFTAASHSLSAVFTPTDTADFSPSTGTTTLVVNPPATPTSTSLVVNTDNVAGDNIGLSSTVLTGSTPVTAGTVSFFADGSATPLNATGITPDATGTATFALASGLPAGTHSIVAKFTPTSVTAFEASQSPPVSFIENTAAPAGTACAQKGSQCSELQNIQTTVPIGTLVINTPYTSSNPLILPDMALNAASTELTTSAPLTCITVTDTTSGGAPWTAQALAQQLSNSTPPASPPAGAFETINPENVGLTGFSAPAPGHDGVGTDGPGVACPDTQSYTGSLAAVDNPAAPGVAPSDSGSLGLGGTGPADGTHAHTFASGSGGDGTATLDALLTLNAPTSTAPGVYKGTITFTVSD
jgi:hypothetical protein